MPHESNIEVAGEFVGQAKRGPGRLVAVATVLTTLAAASIGYLQASAVRAHDEAAVRAERLGALAIKVAAANKDQALTQVERYELLTHAQINEASAPSSQVGRWRYVASKTVHDSQAIARQQQLQVDCSALTASCQIRPLAPVCPHADAAACGAARWAAYEDATQWESYRLTAEREMATAEADAAETRFAHLAAALTMLAVAVFLFGFSLTPQGRERRALFLSCATLFVFAGVVWALAFGLRGYAQPPKAAAMRFADGEVALNQGDAYAQFADMSAARTHYADAVVQLRRATALWPASISAYSDLAQALSDVTLPSDGAYVVPATHVLKAAVADDQRALKNGSESPTVTFDLGAELLFLGIVTNDDAQIANARSLSNTALARFVDERDQGLHPGDYLISAAFSVAEADLAMGSASTATDYRAAIRWMTKLQAEVLPSFVADAACVDINLIVTRRPNRRAEAVSILKQVDSAALVDRPTCNPALAK